MCDVSELFSLRKKFETDRQKDKRFKMKRKILIALLICCFSAKSVVMACSYDYGLAMDAGSTYVDGYTQHTTIHLQSRFPRQGYENARLQMVQREYDPNRPLLGPVTLPRVSRRKDVKPGISSFYKDPNRVCGHLRPLVEFGETTLSKRGVTRKAFKEIPIFLKATAGMRELPQVPRDAIMLNIRLCLSDHAVSPFKFKWRSAA